MQMPVLMRSMRTNLPCCLAILDDIEDIAARVRDDPAVAVRPAHSGAHERDPLRLPERLHESAEDRGLDERHVAVKDEHVAAGIKKAFGGHEGVGRSLLLCLEGVEHPGIEEARLHRLALVAGDDDNRGGIELTGRFHDISDHGPAHDGMGDLRRLRLHTRALSGCEYDTVKIRHLLSPSFRTPVQ